MPRCMLLWIQLVLQVSLNNEVDEAHAMKLVTTRIDTVVHLRMEDQLTGFWGDNSQYEDVESSLLSITPESEVCFCFFEEYKTSLSEGVRDSTSRLVICTSQIDSVLSIS